MGLFFTALPGSYPAKNTTPTSHELRTDASTILNRTVLANIRSGYSLSEPPALRVYQISQCRKRDFKAVCTVTWIRARRIGARNLTGSKGFISSKTSRLNLKPTQDLFNRSRGCLPRGKVTTHLYLALGSGVSGFIHPFFFFRLHGVCSELTLSQAGDSYLVPANLLLLCSEPTSVDPPQ
jgi:hypothetical protein